MGEHIIHSKTYGDMKVLVDDRKDYLFEDFNYSIIKANRNFYAKRSIFDKVTKKSHTHYLHWDIIGKPKKPLVTDHINRDSLDNRKTNLRHCTTSVNGQNSYKYHANHHGVSWDKIRKKWRVYYLNQTKGYFSNLEEAIEFRKQFDS